MNAKEYLNQARYLDNRIKSKIFQIETLKDLATRCTPIYSDMPKNPNCDGSRMESAILDIVELKNEIDRDLRELIGLKKEIKDVINQIENPEYQILLEERYLSSITWEQIAIDLGYEVRNVYNLHGKALKEVKVPKHYKSVQ